MEILTTAVKGEKGISHAIVSIDNYVKKEMASKVLDPLVLPR